MSRNIQPGFHDKTVIYLHCINCDTCLCARGMKAILLADTKVELYSTDLPPEQSIQLIGSDYRTKSCFCRIKDVACQRCGCVVGYHVILPCSSCLTSCNNGHFWMFHSDVTYPLERLDSTGTEVMLWGSLPSCAEDRELRMANQEIECFR
ncbi:protein FAM72A-like [Xenia sp. Carnegie-2017]|uniref:protein FAM72A-like n=1 Tax=Xenia sp. Carnegie-2017 TaxID=2897299 RepID=UPI001F03A5B2|nr:protein FAM72A-like [Xenia sp. Carnegie-2017]